MKLIDLFANEQQWTRGRWARDEDGNGILSTDKKACSWCLEGRLFALSAEHPGVVSAQVYTALDKAVVALGSPARSFVAYNDLAQTKFEDIKRLLALADIELEKINYSIP